MSDKHEEFLAALINGRTQPGSGNQFNGQMDVRNHPDQSYPLAIDGKSTMGKSITITLDMITKAWEQSHLCQPAFGLRWYPDQTGRNAVDWVAVPAEVFQELLVKARRAE